MNNDHNKKFGLLKFHSGYGKFYSRKITNAQTGWQQHNIGFLSHNQTTQVLLYFNIAKIHRESSIIPDTF